MELKMFDSKSLWVGSERLFSSPFLNPTPAARFKSSPQFSCAGISPKATYLSTSNKANSVAEEKFAVRTFPIHINETNGANSSLFLREMRELDSFDDEYGGVIINPERLPSNPKVFGSKLRSSLSHWKAKAHGISHLVLPTRDYLFAPSLNDICQAVQHKQMMPETAYNYVKSIRPRVLLASPQWQAVQEFYRIKVKKAYIPSHMNTLILKTSTFLAARDHVAFDDGSVVLVTEADLDGYDPSHDSGAVGSKIWTDLSLVYRIQVTGQAALTRLSCLWFRCHTQKMTDKKHQSRINCPIMADQMEVLSVNIHVY
ncbi:Phosphoric monoester hydrolase [Sarracenia purpurea var. burkii]